MGWRYDNASDIADSIAEMRWNEKCAAERLADLAEYDAWREGDSANLELKRLAENALGVKRCALTAIMSLVRWTDEEG